MMSTVLLVIAILTATVYCKNDYDNIGQYHEGFTVLPNSCGELHHTLTYYRMHNGNNCSAEATVIACAGRCGTHTLPTVMEDT